MDRDTGTAEPTIDELAELVGRQAQRHGYTVAVAESLTGGAIASALAAAPNAGQWFAGGVVAYQDHVKFGLLGVAPGPVASAACARQMAGGVRRLLDTSVAVAVTGVGGPEPDQGQPPGTAFVASAGPDGEIADHRLDASGEPAEVVGRTVADALETLLTAICAAERAAG